MSSRSRKQNAKNKRDQKRKRKEKQRTKKKHNSLAMPAPRGIAYRRQARLESLTPEAWEGENPLDVAVFDTNVFSALDTESQHGVNLVKHAIDLIAKGQYEQATESVSGISRKNPLRDWRMLVAGLQHWYMKDLDLATKSWSRLDTTRRPHRIALALMLAHGKDLSRPKPMDIHEPEPSGDPDDTLIASAETLRRTCIDRAAIKIAIAGTEKYGDVSLEPPGTTIIPEMIEWLLEFARDFRQTEPRLVKALELAALEKASDQNYGDIFELAVKFLRGPAHDPKNLLTRYFYQLRFAAPDRKTRAHLKKYLTIDLPANKAIPKPLANAITSLLLLMEIEIEHELNEPSFPFSTFAFIPMSQKEVSQVISKFHEAVAAYPENNNAHVRFTEWLQQNIDSHKGDKAFVEQLQSELMNAMQRWTEALPGEKIPRQFLTDTLLDQENLAEAEPHVNWLQRALPGDLKVQALPWKLQMLTAMQLSRRKSNLQEALSTLESAEALWPEWLPALWLRYHKSAWMLRSGDHTSYEQLRHAICQDTGHERDSLVDACMMLGAAQNMKVPSADLKPLREPVNAAVTGLHSLKTTELVNAGSFFWHMTQAGISYPAFRMHGSKIGRELLDRISRMDSLPPALDQRPIWESIMWMSENCFWQQKWDIKIASSIYEQIGKNTYLSGAVVNAVSQTKYPLIGATLEPALKLVKQAAHSDPDPFYRYWFNHVVQQFEAGVKRTESIQSTADRFRSLLNNDLVDDEECQCPACVAEREAERKRQAAHVPDEPHYFQTELF
jgi:hypothetical protein